VRISSFRNKALRRLYEDGSARGLPPDYISKLRAIFAVLDNMKSASELNSWPLWKVHQLGGDRDGYWSLNVTRNWRFTFRIEADELHEVNLEDYH
jgi:toxin HigB-1